LNKKRTIIFDVGANIRQSIISFKKNFPNSIIHSFKPCKEFFDKILKIKKKYKSFFANNCAISNKKANFFYYKDDFGTNSSYFKINIFSKDYISMKKNSLKKIVKATNVMHSVKIISLDSYIKDNKINYTFIF